MNDFEKNVCCAYRAFSRLLQYPYENIYKYILNESLKDLRALFELPFISKSTLKLIDDYAKELESLNNVAIEELRSEYVRLFDLSPKCSPYESVYFKGELMCEPAIDMLKRLKTQGLESKELPDHIATELEFMYYLAYNVLHYVNIGDQENFNKFLEMEKEFMKTHLSKAWIIKLFTCIKKSAQLKFYRIVAELTLGFILDHARYLEGINK